MQSVSSRIWTRVAVSNSCDNNHYTTGTSKNSLIIKIFNKLNSLIHSRKVIFCWIPSHIGIQGNDKADSLAKAAIIMTPDKNIKTSYK